MNIAFFDFDGTITSRDSMIDFILYAAGYKKFFTCMILLFPYFLKYRAGLIKNWQAKEKMINYFFGGWEVSQFDKVVAEYSERKLPSIIRSIAKQAIDEHKKKRDTVVVVSASSEKWLKPWCDTIGIEFIGTLLEEKMGVITGKISGINCYGIEKVNRIKSIYRLSDYDTIYSYGDSRGDKEMMALANVKYYKWRRV